MPELSPIWSDGDLCQSNPHATPDKAHRVQAMFAAIAPCYDLNNSLHSLGQDARWRRRAVALAEVQTGERVLDIACGTGKLTAAFTTSPAAHVIGADFTPEMLAIAKRKHCANITPRYLAGDAMRLPIVDHSVNVLSIAFGIRNVLNPVAAAHEFYRVLRPGGRIIVLEFGMPKNRILHWAYNFYFTRVLPVTASLVARDRSGAYKYLPRSVQTFIDSEGMTKLLLEAGFIDIQVTRMTMGIALVYRGRKR